MASFIGPVNRLEPPSVTGCRASSRNAKSMLSVVLFPFRALYHALYWCLRLVGSQAGFYGSILLIASAYVQNAFRSFGELFTAMLLCAIIVKGSDLLSRWMTPKRGLFSARPPRPRKRFKPATVRVLTQDGYQSGHPGQVIRRLPPHLQQLLTRGTITLPRTPPPSPQRRRPPAGQRASSSTSASRRQRNATR